MLNWDDNRHRLGVAHLDVTHRNFVELATEVARAGPDDFPSLFEALTEHTRDHFANENSLMRSCAFPAIGEHEGEHRRVLKDMERLLNGIYEGRAALARIYVKNGLPEWFHNHLATMDAALAAKLKRQRVCAPE